MGEECLMKNLLELVSTAIIMHPFCTNMIAVIFNFNILQVASHPVPSILKYCRWAHVINMYSCKDSYVKYCIMLQYLFPFIIFHRIAVEEFMQAHWQLLAHIKISLKLHFLKVHAIPQMKHFRSGLWKMNEQGGENAHSKQNRLREIVPTWSSSLCTFSGW